MGEHDAFRVAGGAGGKTDEGGGERLEGVFGKARWGDGFRSEDVEGVGLVGGAVADDEVERGGGDDVLAFGSGEFLGQRDQTGIGQEDADGEDDVIDPVRAMQADAGAAAEFFRRGADGGGDRADEVRSSP